MPGSRPCPAACTCAKHRQLADRHGWKGQEATRLPRHIRVYRRRGKAADYPCVRCSELGAGRRAREWAQVHGTTGDDPWADFVPLCRRCHFRYDGLKLGGLTRSKLDRNGAAVIRQRIADGDRLMDIAADYGISPPTVSNIKAGRIWRVV